MHAQHGFSLVELLIVMLLIGLLAAIAVPSFFTQREKAFDARAKATVRTAAEAIEMFATDHNGGYAGATPGDLQAIEQTLAGAPLAVNSTGADSYRLTVTSDSGNSFVIERRADGTNQFPCDMAGRGGCPSTGEWR